jgi:amino acid transporter
VSTATNSSVYPHLFQSYLKVHLPILNDWLMGTACMVVFILSMTYVNYRGLDIVSSLGLMLMVFIMAPFFLITVFGFSEVNPENWLIGIHNPPKVGSEDLLALFNVLFWNLNNWDTVSTIAGEVSNARKVIPKALITALIVTTLAYVMPLTVGTGVMKDVSDMSVWEPGYFQEIALAVGGRWLSMWILLAASVSVVGQFQALVSSCSYQLQGMAELGWLPKAFARKSVHNTPTVGLGIALVIVLILTQLEFIDILQYLNVVYACAQAIEFTAFLYMRYQYPHIPRHFRVPLNFFGCCALMVLPFCFIAIIVFLPVFTQRWDIVVFCVTALVMAVVSYAIIEVGRARRWWEFIRSPPQNLEEVILFHKTPGAGPLGERLLSRSQHHSLDNFGLT